MDEVLIGCPLRDREWILPKWKEHVLIACEAAGLAPSFVFVLDESESSMVEDWDSTTLVRISGDNPFLAGDDHDWNTERFKHMVFLRNSLLGAVREAEPELFLSLDSDILLHEDSLKSILDVFELHSDAWAVGGKAYMGEGRWAPSYGMWNSKAAHGFGFSREPLDTVTRVDVIMGCKAMKYPAYQTDYKYHHWGEDIGWSSNIAQRNGLLWWDGRVTNKHVMKKEMLEKIDGRCGY
jgi:hypothetical protein